MWESEDRVVTSTARADASATPARRRLGWVGVIALILAFLFIPAIVDYVAKATFDNYFPELSRATGLLPGRITELVLIVVVITVLRWWPVVLHETLRARGWVWIVVLVPLGMSLGFTDWSNLAAAGWALSLMVLLLSLIIGFSEELLFRGVVLTAMRDRYGREWLAALITTVLFAVSHAPAGVPNVISTLVTGFLFYWMRRVSGGIVVPAMVHGIYDFAVFSSYTGPDPASTDSLSLALFLVGAALCALLLVLHRHAAPPASPASSPRTDSPSAG
jgi:membrane protease YdiL (CAAX protease family)